MNKSNCLKMCTSTKALYESNNLCCSHSPSDVVVGFEQTAVNISESAGRVELCVSISQPSTSAPIPFTFSLILNTETGSACMLCNDPHLHHL